MLYVFQTFALWFLAALILGLVVGWFTWSNEPRGPWFSGWFGLATAVTVIALVVALVALVPGRAGLWLETALFSIGDYTLGCLLGGMLRSLGMYDAPRLAYASAAPSRSVRPAKAAATPPPAPKLPDEDKHEGKRPPGLASARGGVIDNLKLIKGVGHQNEGRLHGLGIWHFDQIAAWTRDNVRWVGSYLAFSGRIERERWVAQAKRLSAGKNTAFANRVKAGRVKTSADDGELGLHNVEKLKPKKTASRKKK